MQACHGCGIRHARLGFGRLWPGAVAGAQLEGRRLRWLASPPGTCAPRRLRFRLGAALCCGHAPNVGMQRTRRTLGGQHWRPHCTLHTRPTPPALWLCNFLGSLCVTGALGLLVSGGRGHHAPPLQRSVLQLRLLAVRLCDGSRGGGKSTTARLESRHHSLLKSRRQVPHALHQRSLCRRVSRCLRAICSNTLAPPRSLPQRTATALLSIRGLCSLCTLRWLLTPRPLPAVRAATAARTVCASAQCAAW